MSGYTETDVHGKTVYVCNVCGKPVGKTFRKMHADTHVERVVEESDCKACATPPKAKRHTCGLADMQDLLRF